MSIQSRKSSVWTYSQLPLLILFFISSGILQAQEACSTSGGENPIGPIIEGVNAPTGNTDGPFFVRVFLHPVGKTNGADTPSEEQLRQSLNWMSRDFAEHNIFFEWDCISNPIHNTTLYSSTFSTPSILCDIENYAYNGNGIDIFIGGDLANRYGEASGVPGKAFIIKGTFLEPEWMHVASLLRNG
ncbi:MAG: hypothetical protein R2787_13285 [Saprospiraceae bacterium]